MSSASVLHPKSTRRAQFKRPRPAVRLLAVVLAVFMLLLSAPMIYTGAFLLRLGGGGTFDPNLGLIPDDNGDRPWDDHLADYTAPDYVTGIAVRGDTESIENILIVGVDSRNSKSFVGLSDSIMILTLDHYRKQIRISALMRDIYVEIPNENYNGRYFNKLNASYSLGGIDLLRQTIEERFFLKLDRYVLVNFNAFTRIIDTVGGVNIEMTAQESRQVPTLKSFSGDPRTVKLNGTQALAYARIRKIDSDFQRSGRQQKVMTQVFSQVSGSSPLQLANLAQACAPYVNTNISNSELLALAGDIAAKYKDYELHTGYYVPQGQEDYAGVQHDYFSGNMKLKGGGVMFIFDIHDWEKSILELHRHIYNDDAE